MAHKPADRIRNVALIGHRGSGKTSLTEALLYEAGVVECLSKDQELDEIVAAIERAVGART